MSEPQPLLTVKGVASLLHVHATTIRRWMKSGSIEFIELPRQQGAKRRTIRIPQSVIDKLLQQREEK